MLVDNTRRQRIGSNLALAMSFSNSGLIAGPVISGSVFQIAGYWSAWAVPFALLTIDFVARLAMVDRKPRPTSSLATSGDPRVANPRECEDLLGTSHSNYNTTESGPDSLVTSTTERDQTQDADNDLAPDVKQKPRGFYRVVLPNIRIWVGLSNTVIQTLLIVGFDTTLPLYLMNDFHWGTLSVGMIFLGIQGPQIIIGPLIGSLRDRFGVRVLTVLGWLILVLFLWLLACPTKPSFHWASPGTNGKAIAIASIVGIGFGLLLVRGAGSFQLVGSFQDPFLPWIRLQWP